MDSELVRITNNECKGDISVTLSKWLSLDARYRYRELLKSVTLSNRLRLAQYEDTATFKMTCHSPYFGTYIKFINMN